MAEQIDQLLYSTPRLCRIYAIIKANTINKSTFCVITCRINLGLTTVPILTLSLALHPEGKLHPGTLSACVHALYSGTKYKSLSQIGIVSNIVFT